MHSCWNWFVSRAWVPPLEHGGMSLHLYAGSEPDSRGSESQWKGRLIQLGTLMNFSPFEECI